MGYRDVWQTRRDIRPPHATHATFGVGGVTVDVMCGLDTEVVSDHFTDPEWWEARDCEWQASDRTAGDPYGLRATPTCETCARKLAEWLATYETRSPRTEGEQS